MTQAELLEQETGQEDQEEEFEPRTIQLRLIGRNPLLMHSDRGVNILDDLVRQKKAITGKRKKTDEDQARIARLEWEISLYFDPQIGPFIPDRCIEASLTEGAKLVKRGKDIGRGLQVLDPINPLRYKGDDKELAKTLNGSANREYAKLWSGRNLENMWESRLFHDTRSVGQQQARIMRCRPKFIDWWLECTVVYDARIWNPNDLIEVAEKAGDYCGLGDYRPKFGRFAIQRLD